MEKDIMQEVAFLFVEQYEKLVEPYKDSEVALILISFYHLYKAKRM